MNSVSNLLEDIQKEFRKGISLIKKYEPLEKDEGYFQIEGNFLTNKQKKDFSITLYSPHLIPFGNSFSWTEETLELCLEKCYKDICEWVKLEREAPRFVSETLLESLYM